MALLAALMALAYPSYGVARATGSLMRSARWPFDAKRDALREAQRAGALVMVVRSSSWRPGVGDRLSNVTTRAAQEVR